VILVSQKDKIKLLILDDDVQIVNSISRFFQKQFDIIVTRNASDAINLLNKQSIAIALLDYNLNDNINGVEISKSLKNTNPFIRTIMVTGENNIYTAIEALNSGAVDSFLTKPINIQELRGVIQKNLDAWISTKEKLDIIVSKLHRGDEISQSDINFMGLKHLYLDKIISEDLKLNAIDKIECLGVVVTQGLDTICSIQGELLKIKHPQIYAGFIDTLTNISKSLFQESELHKIKKIRIQDIDIYIKNKNSTNYTFYFTKFAESNIIYEKLNEVIEFIDVILKNPKYDKEKLRDIVQEKIEVLNLNLSKMDQLI